MSTTKSSAILGSKQEGGHEFWPDNDFTNSCQEFGRIKALHS